MKRVLAIALLVAIPSVAVAQGFDLNALLPAGGASATGKIIQLVSLLTVLSLAPGLLVMVTSFTRFVVALSFLRSGLGLAKHAGQSGFDQPVFVHDILRHGADLRSGLAKWRKAVNGEQYYGAVRRFPKSSSRFASSCSPRCATRI